MFPTNSDKINTSLRCLEVALENILNILFKSQIYNHKKILTYQMFHSNTNPEQLSRH